MPSQSPAQGGRSHVNGSYIIRSVNCQHDTLTYALTHSKTYVSPKHVFGHVGVVVEAQMDSVLNIGLNPLIADARICARTHTQAYTRTGSPGRTIDAPCE
eukprot:GHVU01020812.1.p1 GENE.GHVU01020812.1~~GHVU01020812.1.p1  ORF type:complete len:100 (-),score=0.73 GHVU01020812.1:183-482(-)